MTSGATDVYIYDHNAEPQIILQDFVYLEYTQRLSDSWNYVLRLEFGKDDKRLTFFRETLARDFIFEVWRTDPVTGDRELVWEGFHRTLVDQVKTNGTIILTLYGVGYTELIKRRIILPPAGQETSNKTGPAETIIKAFATDSMVTPTDLARTVQGFTVESDAGAGSTAEYSARYTNLYTALIRSAEQGGVDFGVVKGLTVGTFILEARTLWGLDVRIGNAAGNDPIIFDLLANNMLTPILSNNSGDEINFVYVGGQGEGINRTIITVSDATQVGKSPWNRREDFTDARNESNSTGLVTRGQATLDERGFTRKLSFNVQQTDVVRWPRDWGLGYLVTARYFEQEFEKKIIQVTVSISAGESGSSQLENISPEMEDISA